MGDENKKGTDGNKEEALTELVVNEANNTSSYEY
jgi:hypothetical protein